jgi:ribosome maturation factor RimP
MRIRRKRKAKRTVDKKSLSLERRNSIVSYVKQLAEPLCKAENLEMVHAEYELALGQNVLRVFIDKPGGVTLDDCSNVSRQLSDLIDVNPGKSGLDHAGRYHLEVSSPGADRPLGKLSDYRKFDGKTVKIETSQFIHGLKNFRGILSGTLEGMIKIKLDDDIVLIPFNEIVKARLVDFDGEKRC